MRAFSSILALAVAACASYDGHSLRPGASTEAEVRNVMGAPALEFAGGDGSRRLAYPRGPLGTQTFMVEVGTDGVLRAVRQVLDDDTFSTIVAGLKREDVLRMIGPPGQTMHFPRLGHTAWDYRYTDTWGYLAEFSVILDSSGVVVGKVKRRLQEKNGRN